MVMSRAANGPDAPAVAQDRNPVRQRERLVEHVSDEHDRDAPGAEHDHAVIGLAPPSAWWQRCGRLVEDQQLSVQPEATGISTICRVA